MCPKVGWSAENAQHLSQPHTSARLLRSDCAHCQELWEVEIAALALTWELSHQWWRFHPQLWRQTAARTTWFKGPHSVKEVLLDTCKTTFCRTALPALPLPTFSQQAAPNSSRLWGKAKRIASECQVAPEINSPQKLHVECTRSGFFRVAVCRVKTTSDWFYIHKINLPCLEMSLFTIKLLEPNGECFSKLPVLYKGVPKASHEKATGHWNFMDNLAHQHVRSGSDIVKYWTRPLQTKWRSSFLWFLTCFSTWRSKTHS